MTSSVAVMKETALTQCARILLLAWENRPTFWNDDALS